MSENSLDSKFVELHQKIVELKRQIAQEAQRKGNSPPPIFRALNKTLQELQTDVGILQQRNKEFTASREMIEAKNDALLEAARAVLEFNKFEDAVKIIFDCCKNLIGADVGYTALLSKDGSENAFVSCELGGNSCSLDSSLPTPVRGLREKVCRLGRPVYDNDFGNSKLTKLIPEGHVKLKNVMFAPLKIEGKVVGLIGLANKPGGFTDEDARVASSFGEFAAVALHNSRMLDSLEDSEKRFRSVAQTASDAIISIDNQGNVVLWNKAAEKVFGFKADEIMGKPLINIMPERFQEAHQKGFQRLISTGQGTIIGKTVEMVGRKKNGNEFPIELSIASWMSGEDAYFTGIVRDITERKQIEQEIENQARFLSENPNPVLRISSEGTLLYANAASDSLLREWQCQVGQTVPDPWRTAVSEVLDSERANNIEFQHDDTIFSFVLIPVTDAQYVDLYGRDITEQKRVEEEYALRRYYLAKAQEIGSVGTWDLDIKKNKLVWTDETYRIFGIPIGTELTYESFLNCVHPDDRQYVETKWKAALNKEPYDIEHRIVVNGNIKWIREKAELVFDDGGNCVSGIGFAQDITARKQAEEALQQARDQLEKRVEERTAELMEANKRLQSEIAERMASEEALRLDEARLEAMVRLNELATRVPSQQLAYFALEEAVKLTRSKIGFLGFISDDETEMHIHAWSGHVMQECAITNKPLSFKITEAGLWGEAVRQRKPIMINDYHDHKMWKKGYPEGHVCISRYLGTPVFDGERIVAIISVANKDDEYQDDDVRQLTLLMGSLLQLVQREKANEEVHRHQAELAHVSRLSTMVEMGSTIAHELNQPLCAILSYTQGCLRMMKSPDGDRNEIIVAMEQVAGQARRAGDIIQHLKDFSRKREPHRSTIDINAIVKEAVSLIAPDAKRGNIILKLELCKQLPQILGDSIEIEQVIINLLRNGIEAMEDTPDNRKELTVKTAPAEDNTILIEFRDMGHGLPGSKADQVFEPFYSTKEGGMGIGLSISKSIIEAHGGRLYAQSNSDFGATFAFILPVNENNQTKS